MEREGLGIQNSNGGRLIEFCSQNNFVIGGSKLEYFLKHKDIHMAVRRIFIRRSQFGKYKSQIDHFMIDRK